MYLHDIHNLSVLFDVLHENIASNSANSFKLFFDFILGLDSNGVDDLKENQRWHW